MVYDNSRTMNYYYRFVDELAPARTSVRLCSRLVAVRRNVGEKSNNWRKKYRVAKQTFPSDYYRIRIDISSSWNYQTRIVDFSLFSFI